MRSPAISLSSILPSPLSLWRSQAATIARFTLLSYMKSGWILGDIVFLWLLYAIFFLSFGGDVSYFYGTAGPGLAILAVLGTAIMNWRAMQARIYLPLSRLTSRAAYVFGLIIATSTLRILSFMLMLLLAMGYHTHAPGLGIEHATIGNMLPGAIGVLLYIILLSVLTVLLSAPIATRRIQISFLAWVAAILYSNSSPISVAHYLSITRIPLAPIIACYNFGITGTINVYGLIMALLMICYIASVFWLCTYCFKQRDLTMR